MILFFFCIFQGAEFFTTLSQQRLQLEAATNELKVRRHQNEQMARLNVGDEKNSKLYFEEVSRNLRNCLR